MSSENDLGFWSMASHGASFLNVKTGFSDVVLEYVYQKYLAGHVLRDATGKSKQFEREDLYMAVAFLKQYPRQGCFDNLAPHHKPRSDRYVRWIVWHTVAFLADNMVEITVDHFDHPGNHVPHFPEHVVGGVDTFPVFALGGPHRNQPKYKANVFKFQAYVSHLGFIGFLSGPHPGAFSDTTLARHYHPRGQRTYLADLAYVSVPFCLPPHKGDQTAEEEEFTRVHQWYRARTEHCFAKLHAFSIVD